MFAAHHKDSLGVGFTLPLYLFLHHLHHELSDQYVYPAVRWLAALLDLHNATANPNVA